MNSTPTIQQSNAPPAEDEFTPLQQHQEQTPSTFFGAKPVLYSHYAGLAISASREKLQSHSVFAQFNAESEGTEEGDVLVKDVEVWVNSRDFTLFQMSPAKLGVSIPYPNIALHAVMKKNGVDALLMNLSLNDTETVNDADDIEILELVLLPPDFDKDAPQAPCIREIFEALNKCAELHPDPYDGEEGEPDLTAPGATGWITADNMDEYLDENGNFVGTVIGGEELGPGAGTVRQRDGEDEEEAGGLNGVNGHEEKYQRTG